MTDAMGHQARALWRRKVSFYPVLMCVFVGGVYASNVDKMQIPLLMHVSCV